MLKSCFKKLEKFSNQNLENCHAANKLNFVKSIECKNVHFRFLNEYPILNGINLKIERKLTYIRGSGSSGKTTLFNNLAKIRVPMKGSIIINGIDSNNYHESCIREKIHFCCSEQAFFTGSIQENIFLGQTNIDDKLLDEVLELLQLKPRMLKSNIRLNQMLGGQLKLPFSFTNMQLLKICRAMVSKADILIFDDPFVGLDIETAKVVENALRIFCQKYQKGLCIISSRPTELKYDYLYELDKGVLVTV